MLYSIATSSTNNYFLIDSFINEQDENIIIYNNININSIDLINVIQKILQISQNPYGIFATGFKKNNDDTFFITTSNSNIRLFSNDLIELKSFNTSNTFELVDFSKIDEESITATGTSYEKMFPESDFYTKLDIQIEKMNDTQILNNFSFSGIGTSRAFSKG